MVNEGEREALKRRIWSQQDRISCRAIMRREGITREELSALYDEAINDYRDETPKFGMVGRHFGAWKVIAEEETYKSKNGRYAHTYLCRCECGEAWVISGGDLVGRKVNDCGCGAYSRSHPVKAPIDWLKKIEVKHYV